MGGPMEGAGSGDGQSALPGPSRIRYIRALEEKETFQDEVDNHLSSGMGKQKPGVYEIRREAG